MILALLPGAGNLHGTKLKTLNKMLRTKQQKDILITVFFWFYPSWLITLPFTNVSHCRSFAYLKIHINFTCAPERWNCHL